MVGGVGNLVTAVSPCFVFELFFFSTSIFEIADGEIFAKFLQGFDIYSYVFFFLILCFFYFLASPNCGFFISYLIMFNSFSFSLFSLVFIEPVLFVLLFFPLPLRFLFFYHAEFILLLLIILIPPPHPLSTTYHFFSPKVKKKTCNG